MTDADVDDVVAALDKVTEAYRAELMTRPGARGDVTRLESLRTGVRPVVLYPLLALLSFPTLGHLLAGRTRVAYALDVVRASADRAGAGLARERVDALEHASHGRQCAVRAAVELRRSRSTSPLAFVVGPFAAYVVYVWLMAAVAGISMHLFLRDSLRLSTVAVVAGRDHLCLRLLALHLRARGARRSRCCSG